MSYSRLVIEKKFEATMAEGLDSRLSELDGFMIDFYPLQGREGSRYDYDSNTIRFIKMKNVRDPERQPEFERRVKAWLKQFIRSNFPDDTVVIAIAPSSTAFTKTSFMYGLIETFIAENSDLAIEDGSNMLVRYKSIQKQTSITRYFRDESTHRDSLRIEGADDISKLNEGKVVVILDDVYTSGCTLHVCREKVLQTSPKDVKIVAIGKTVSD